jgi:hypothetical protein
MEFMDPIEPPDTPLPPGERGLLSRRGRSRGRQRFLANWLGGYRGIWPVARRCVRHRCGSGIGGLEGLRDDGQMALEHTFDRLAHVLQQVPSIGDLLGLGCSLGGRL